MKLPFENKTFQFPNIATVQFTNNLSKATEKHMPKLYVQAIDAYGFQREWTLQFRYEPGDSKNLFWESHIYMHPGRRAIVKVEKGTAEKVIERFLMLCEKYPDLLFNQNEQLSDRFRPRCGGFVLLAEMLHRETPLSVDLF